jgi:protein-S-isoprenylcysteine O-methyltransferase Ste14
MIGPQLITLVTIIYAVVHSLLASLGVKAWARDRFGPLADRWYRLTYNLFAVISGLPILVLLYLLPDQRFYLIPFPWILLSFLGQLVGILIILVGIQQTGLWSFVGLHQIIEPEEDASTVMVTHGLYRWVRHPLYTGGLLLMWFTPVMTINLLILFSLLSIYLIVGARLEEKRLVTEFGDKYREYQKHVPILLPIPWRK